MAQGFRKIHQLPRDGTSRTGRLLDALDPDSAPIDNRQMDQMLAEVDHLARQFHWFDETGQPSGTWDRLLDPDPASLQGAGPNLERPAARPEMLALLAKLSADPNALPDVQRDQVLPPHVALILACLGLLGRARDRMNGLTARHLDFLFDQVLKFQPRPAEVDRVNVIIRPNRSGSALRMPAGTLLDAGQDAAGQQRVYATEREIVINKAEVAALRSVHAQIDVKDLSTVRQTASSLDQPGLELLKLALGDPMPGDPMPSMATFTGRGSLIPDQALLQGPIQTWINFARVHLFLDFYELRDLVMLKERRDDDAADWALINRAMTQIRRRVGSGGGKVPAGKDFDAKLAWALGQAPDFSEVAEVEAIYDLFRLRDREKVREFMKRAPYDALGVPLPGSNLPVMSPQVVSMMTRKLQIDAEWAAINAHLQSAGRQAQKETDFELSAPKDFDPTAFDANLAAALPELDFGVLPDIGNQGAPNGVRAYMAVIERIEDYLHMSAESVRFLLNQAFPDLNRNTDPDLWVRADKILCETRSRRNIADRRLVLRAALDAAGTDPVARVLAVLALAVARTVDAGTPVASLIADANPLLSSDADRELLTDIQNAVGVGGSGEVDWDALILVAEKIQHNRLGPEADLPQQKIWRNLLAYPDATSVQQELLDGAPDANPRWRTFGDARAAPDGGARLGWAFASPVLALGQGQRNVTLELTLDRSSLTDDQFTKIQTLFSDPKDPPLDVALSGAEGWITGGLIQLFETDSDDEGTGIVTVIRAEMALAPDQPAIVAPGPDHGVHSDEPVLSITVRNRAGAAAQDAGTYAVLRSLRISAVDCWVNVGASSSKDPETGLTMPLLRGDLGLIDAAKPFLPFGPRPVVGSRLTLVHPELICKRVTDLGLMMEWKGIPNANLKTHFKGYSYEGSVSNTAFTVDMEVIDRGVRKDVGAGARLFDRADATQVSTINTRGMAAIETAPPSPPERRANDPLSWDRQLRITLTGRDFGHQGFSSEAANAAQKEPPVFLEPPFAPEIKALGLYYRARAVWRPAAEQSMDDADTFLHLHPFGQTRAGIEGDGKVSFLPEYDHAGELLIGLDGTEAPERVNLLFQMAEGSADPDLIPAPIRWSCLDGDRWLPLEQGEVRFDATRGLINSGVVEIDLPAHAPSTLLPGAKTWLRLAVDRDTASLCDTVAIMTQAVPAVFVDQDNDSSHYDDPLPPEAITRTVRPQAGIGEVLQPFTSFGGRPAEAVENLRTRAAERLRHRNRAVTFWDYERLALDRFPQLYKVKCLPMGKGDVRVIVIPDVSLQRPSDPFEPKASTNLLADIQQHLQARAPMGVDIAVTNARFVPVKIRVAIQFLAGVDTRLARAELNEALKQYLSPWAYQDSEDIVIGGAIWSNSLIDFLARHPTVDYVRAPRLFRYDSGTDRYSEEPADTPGGYRLAARAPDEVLVSARKHEIDEIRAEIEDQQELTGIGYMKLGLDFIVDDETEQQQEEPA